MIRRTLLAGAATLTLVAAAVPNPAHALFGAGDVVFDPSVVAKAVEQIQAMQRQYTQLQQTYQALAHLTSINGVASQLGLPSVQNPLGSVAQLPGIVNGTNLGGVSGLAQRLMSANRYYQPQGNDFTAQEMQRRAQGTAGLQALAMQNLQATQERMAGLQELQSRIDASPTTQDMGAVQARLAAESTFIETQQVQAQQLQVLQRAQEEASQQRVTEKQRQDAESWYNHTAPIGGGQ